MTLSKLFQTTKVNFLLLDPDIPSIVEILPVIGFEPTLGMEKFFPSYDAIFLI